MPLNLHSLYLPHSGQVVYYDEAGHDVCGFDTVREYVWILKGSPLPSDEIIRFVLADNQPVQTPLPGFES